MNTKILDTFKTKSTFTADNKTYTFYNLKSLEKAGFSIDRLPFSLKILLENLLRHEDGVSVSKGDIEMLAKWKPGKPSDKEISFMPARVILQDFTGVPCVADLAAMRDAVSKMGGDTKKINPLIPVELVIDHSVQVDAYGTPQAFDINATKEFERNQERYQFLRWGQTAFNNFAAVPPDTGIVHQVNVEYLARVVFNDKDNLAYPDTLVGTDSHTTMINGLGVLGWGVGGIEAEAAMLGQSVTMLVPEVIGFKLKGKLPEGTTATDLVLTVTEILRKKKVVGKFVEFYGPGVASLTVADRVTIGNMSPEYGSTAAIFPIDQETLDFLRFTGRSEERVQLVEAYAKAQGLFLDQNTPEAHYDDTIELDLSTIVPSLAGPKRPQDRVPLTESKKMWKEALAQLLAASKTPVPADITVDVTKGGGEKYKLGHGSVVVAAITSCTNTSNPSVLIGAGLLAKKAVEKGLMSKPWVKTSLAPGSKVVTAYLEKAGLTPYLDKLNFHLVGYGCTTCIGNSGPLPDEVHNAIEKGNLVAASVLSGNRNFEGRINPDVRANYLASPPLVVAYALAGRMDIDLYKEPLGNGSDGQPVYLKDIWPTSKEISTAIHGAVQADMYKKEYADVFKGDERWQALKIPQGEVFKWEDNSTYIRRPSFFETMPKNPKPIEDITGARVLAVLGDSITTDHISPAGNIGKSSPAAKYLMDHGVAPADFNSYGARRGNHEVMVRGTFANIRLRNLLVPGTEGGVTRHLPDGEAISIYDASMKYQTEGTPLMVIAGKEYGSGSSRDWAAKGTAMLGIKAVIAESYERIHRSNLIGMGVLPLEFVKGQNREILKLTGEEIYCIHGINSELKCGKILKVIAKDAKGNELVSFNALARIDTPVELGYYKHGGIMQFVLRQMMQGA